MESIQHRQIVEGLGGVWVIGAEGFLVDLERALIERFGFGVIAHGIIQRRQIVEGLWRCLGDRGRGLSRLILSAR